MPDETSIPPPSSSPSSDVEEAASQASISDDQPPTPDPLPAPSPPEPQAEELALMFDIHDAQHAASTWKEFLIHIATITLGLLIAIGLEQTVEAIHRSQERHQLEADLHTECIRNDAILTRDLRLASIKRAETIALRNQVEARIHNARAIGPDLPQGNNEDLFKPSEGVWSSARDSSQLAFLPRELTEMYEELYAQPKFATDYTFAMFSAGDNVRNFENQFPAHTPSGHVDLSQLTPDQLSQYSALLTRLVTQNESLASVLEFYARENKIVLNGATSGDELQRRMAGSN